MVLQINIRQLRVHGVVLRRGVGQLLDDLFVKPRRVIRLAEKIEPIREPQLQAQFGGFQFGRPLKRRQRAFVGFRFLLGHFLAETKIKFGQANEKFGVGALSLSKLHSADATTSVICRFCM